MNEMRRNDVEQGANAGIKKIPSVAIVILNWNGCSFLEKFLPSVIASVYDNKRIVVVDNASTDDSVIFLQQYFPEVEIIQHGSNEGFAKGYNAALTLLSDDYYILLNSDVEVTSNWIMPVIELMESDSSIAACQPKILAYNNKQQFEYAGACGGWMDNFGYPFTRGRVFEAVENDNGQYNTAQPCFWASGAALFIRAVLYHESGGLDEYFFAHQEEIDLCWRLQLTGYKIYVQPASVVYHVGGGTLPMGSNKKVFLNFRNNLIMLAKNLPAGSAAWKIPFRIILDMIAAWKALLEGKSGTFISILKAHIYFTKWSFYDRRKSVFARSKTGEIHGWYSGSVVYKYFIKGKKAFSEIVGNK
jgi:GT2 family glycosyltransferase